MYLLHIFLFPVVIGPRHFGRPLEKDTHKHPERTHFGNSTFAEDFSDPKADDDVFVIFEVCMYYTYTQPHIVDTPHAAPSTDGTVDVHFMYFSRLLKVLYPVNNPMVLSTK